MNSRRPSAADIAAYIQQHRAPNPAWAQEDGNVIQDAYASTHDPDDMVALLKACELLGMLELSTNHSMRGGADRMFFRLRDPAGKFHRIDTNREGFADAVRKALPTLPPLSKWAAAAGLSLASTDALELWAERIRARDELPASRWDDAREAWRTSAQGMNMFFIAERKADPATVESVRAAAQAPEIRGAFTTNEAALAEAIRGVLPNAPLPAGADDGGQTSAGSTSSPSKGASLWQKVSAWLRGGEDEGAGSSDDGPPNWRQNLAIKRLDVGCITCGEEVSRTSFARCWNVDSPDFGELTLVAECEAHGRFSVIYEVTRRLPVCPDCDEAAELDIAPEQTPGEAGALQVKVQTFCPGCGERLIEVDVGPKRVGAEWEAWADRPDRDQVVDLFDDFQVGRPFDVEVIEPVHDGVRVRLGDLDGYCPESIAHLIGRTCRVVGLQFDLSRNEMLVSRAGYFAEAEPRMKAGLHEGDELDGIIQADIGMGYFVDVGEGTLLLHQTQIPTVDGQRATYEPGQSIRLVVERIHELGVDVRPV